jgi:hypothetical protein
MMHATTIFQFKKLELSDAMPVYNVERLKYSLINPLVMGLGLVLRLRLITNQRRALIFIFSTSCIVRIIPELFAYPYPIGYDVVNYYIPVLANFKAHWLVISGQFPLYILVLHLINIYSGLSPHLTVTTFSTVVFGFFGVSVFLIARRLMELGTHHSIFLTIFVIFQIAVLREAWDLHRDLFAFLTMFLTFALIGRKRKKISTRYVAFALALSVITAISDGMIGALFVTSLIIYAGITRDKNVILCALVASGSFLLAILPSQNAFHINIERFSKTSPITTVPSNDQYNRINLLILFGIINGLLIPTGIIGFKVVKNNLLKIPLLIVIAVSFSWIVFPDMKSLVADRWIIISGVFLSFFTAGGILHLVQRLDSQHVVTAIILSVSGIFAIMGIAYAIMSEDMPFILYAVARNNIETFVPVTMQANSVSIKDTDKIINAVSWINNNTDQNSIITGDKSLRGWIELGLKGNRTYVFSENLNNRFLDKVIDQHRNVYLVTYFKEPNNRSISMVYSNGKFNIYKMGKQDSNHHILNLDLLAIH